MTIKFETTKGEFVCIDPESPKSVKTKLFLAFTALLALAQVVHAQSTAFTYNGQLSNNGTPVTGLYDLRLTIYDASAAGNLIAGPFTVSPVGVTNGLFTARIDFGAGVFTGPARWLNIEVRAAGGSFTLLNPRQEVTSSPYAIRAASAGTAADVSAGSVVKSLNALKDNVTLAAGANVTITPNGNTLTLASAGVGGSGIWSVNGNNASYTAGNVGIGTTAPATALEANGIVRSTRTGQPLQYLQLDGGDSSSYRLTAQSIVQAEKPLIIQNLSGEATPGANNAIHFRLGTTASSSVKMLIDKDGKVGIGSSTPQASLEVVGQDALRLVGYQPFLTLLDANAGYARSRIQAANGDLDLFTESYLSGANPSAFLKLADSGNVGIGATAPAHRLSLIGGPLWTANFWTGALELGNASAIGWQANAGGQRFGIGQSSGGLYFFRTASDPGTTSSPANYDLQITDSGNLSQARDKGGAVKAMLYVNADGSIARCYNAIANSSAGTCGFSITRPIIFNHTVYRIDFGFQVNDRFISVTPHGATSTDIGATFYFEAGTTPNQVDVDTFHTDVDYVHASAEASFMIIVY